MEPSLDVAQHPDPGSRAERVLHALRTLSRNSIASHPMGTIATVAGVSSDTARRGIVDLVALGLIEELPLRTGKKRTFRLLDVGSPQVLVASPQPAALEIAGGTPEGTPKGVLSSGAPEIAAAAAHQGSPAAEAWTQEARDARREVWWESATDEERRAEWDFGCAQLRAIVSRLEGVDAELVDADVGECDDRCGRVEPRLQAGNLRLCRECWSSRQRARLRLQSEARQDGPALSESALPMPSAVVLPPGVQA
jgi:hypothetical protein